VTPDGLIFSMTGFAAVRGGGEDGVAFSLTAKSVNHRFLDLQFRMPGGFDGAEAKLRQMLKSRLRRGHVDVTLVLDRGDRSERASEGELRVNEDLLGAAVRAYRAAARTHGLAGEPDLNVLLRLPGVMAVERAGAVEATADLEGEILASADDLLKLLLRARADEGAALAAELRRSMERLRRWSAEVGQLRGRVRDAQYERLHARLSEMLDGSVVSAERVLTEAALLADRSDVEEENVRLVTHVERFVAILDGGGEVGKRLDFLLQELSREANTMLSKTGGAVGENGLRITELGLEMKSEIERAREQVQNLE